MKRIDIQICSRALYPLKEGLLAVGNWRDQMRLDLNTAASLQLRTLPFFLLLWHLLYLSHWPNILTPVVDRQIDDFRVMCEDEDEED